MSADMPTHPVPDLDAMMARTRDRLATAAGENEAAADVLRLELALLAPRNPIRIYATLVDWPTPGKWRIGYKHPEAWGDAPGTRRSAPVNPADGESLPDAATRVLAEAGYIAVEPWAASGPSNVLACTAEPKPELTAFAAEARRQLSGPRLAEAVCRYARDLANQAATSDECPNIACRRPLVGGVHTATGLAECYAERDMRGGPMGVEVPSLRAAQRLHSLAVAAGRPVPPFVQRVGLNFVVVHPAARPAINNPTEEN